MLYYTCYIIQNIKCAVNKKHKNNKCCGAVNSIKQLKSNSANELTGISVSMRVCQLLADVIPFACACSAYSFLRWQTEWLCAAPVAFLDRGR